MKIWVCPKCRKERMYEGNLVMKVCTKCNCAMQIIEVEE